MCSNKITDYLEELPWASARKEFPASAHKLRDIIDRIDPPKNFKLIKAKYSFGSKMLENLAFRLPIADGVTVPIGDSRLPTKISEQLSYSNVPFALITKNKVEIFSEITNKIFSVAFHGGDLDIGIWEHFGWTTPYNIVAGARSLYMLPRISDTRSHKRLQKEYGIVARPPTSFFDHWQIFSQLANSRHFPRKWYCEILLFPQNWVEKFSRDPAWHEFNNYVLQKGWQHSGYARRKSILDNVWELFCRTLNNESLKVDPYAIDTLKHLAMIGTQCLPASTPYTGDETTGPIDAIQRIYEAFYNLADYVPTIMQPAYYNTDDNKFLYYSLQVPTLLETMPKVRKAATVIDYLRNLLELKELFFQEAFDNNLMIENTSIKEMIGRLNFEFFHGDMYSYGSFIRPSKEMLEKDKNLLYTPSNVRLHEFAENSPFVRGCIRISTRK